MSGIPLKAELRPRRPRVARLDVRRASSATRASTRSRAACTRRCTAASRGRCACSPASARPRTRTSASSSCSSSGQTGLSTAFDMPTLMGYDPDHARSLGEVGREGVSVASLDDMDAAVRRHPARQGLDVDDDQRAGGRAARALRRGRREAGRPARQAARHAAERHAQGVHRAEGVDLADPRPHADHPRHARVLHARRCRSGTRSRSAAITSAKPARPAVQELAFTIADGIGYVQLGIERGPRRRRVRAAAVVLLRRPQRLLRGDREVPRRRAACGRRSCASASARRTRSRGCSARTRRPPACR